MRGLLLARVGVVAGALAFFGAAGMNAASAAGARPDQHTVFFHADSAELTPHAAEMVAASAKEILARKAAGTLSHVKVISYADAAGSDAGMHHIAEDRGNAVRDALTKDGVPAELITVQGRTKDDPALQNADDVTQLKHRRVRIVFYGQGQ